MASQHFPYRLDRRYAPVFFLLRLKETDGVEVTDGELIARYGRARFRTPVSNVKGAVVSGPHRWYTAVGIRLSARDDGLTFGTNKDRGLWISLHDKVKRVVGPRDHSYLWVSVEDPEGLAAALGIEAPAAHAGDDPPK